MALVTNQYAFFDTNTFFYRVTDKFMFIGLFMTILPALAGYVFGMSKDNGVRKTISLSVILALVGFLMNALTWGWKYTFSWNVLQFVGLSFLVIAIAVEFFTYYEIFLLSLMTILAAAFLRITFAASNMNDFVAIFIGGKNEFMLWPFFPWFGVVGFGFLYARYKLKYGDSAWFNPASFCGGLALIGSAILRNEFSVRLDPDYVWGPSILTPTLGWVLATLGFFLVLMVLGDVFFSKIKLKKYGIINSYSKGIMWIYAAQMLVSFKAAIWVKRFFPMDEPSWAYFIFLAVMLVFGWFVGFLSIKLFQEKRIVVFIKKYHGK